MINVSWKLSFYQKAKKLMSQTVLEMAEFQLEPDCSSIQTNFWNLAAELQCCKANLARLCQRLKTYLKSQKIVH